ncbi:MULTISPECIES: hypothetical protein [unclassified Streptomyces]|uniref:Type II toxin-antitoxin system HicA family toxin n=1 Tax=Streptomyces sp. gb1(2016) TaxID=1828321 RepID=A0A652KE66_9ACTN|nr:hypothetical protein [Streptomyces sp. gb1(2016)]TXS21834.1 hypothetical protein EAO74_37095 [Streptomyces sp. gb1(2016)]
MNKDIQQLIKKLERQNFEVRPLKSNYCAVFAGKVWVVNLPCTPSSSRTIKNVKAALKRHGFHE